MSHADNMRNLQTTVDRLVREAQRAVQAETSWRPAWEQWQRWLTADRPGAPGAVVGVAYGGQLLHHAAHAHNVWGYDPYEPYDDADETSVDAETMEIRWAFVRARLGSRGPTLVRRTWTSVPVSSMVGYRWLFIDGCHQYEDVLADIRHALDGLDLAFAMIGGHDYLSGWTGVTRAVDECCPPGFRVEVGNACCWRYVRA
jgi:hypothetical protein